MLAPTVPSRPRFQPLPHPHRRVERRRYRPTDTASALISAFDHAVARAELDAAILVDEYGMLVSKNTTDLDLNQLAAVTPIVARGHAAAAIRRRGEERELCVREVEILGETLFVAALGGDKGPREREASTIAAAADRILNA
ncbi:MAG: hypothetical protein R3A79_31840 [Nannocystaceae bacterium]